MSICLSVCTSVSSSSVTKDWQELFQSPAWLVARLMSHKFSLIFRPHHVIRLTRYASQLRNYLRGSASHWTEIWYDEAFNTPHINASKWKFSFQNHKRSPVNRKTLTGLTIKWNANIMNPNLFLDKERKEEKKFVFPEKFYVLKILKFGFMWFRYKTMRMLHNYFITREYTTLHITRITLLEKLKVDIPNFVVEELIPKCKT